MQLAYFLLNWLYDSSFHYLLIFCRVDLCHQPSDEDDEEYTEALLEKTRNEAGSSHVDRRRRICSFCSGHVGNRQKFVILVCHVMPFGKLNCIDHNLFTKF